MPNFISLKDYHLSDRIEEVLIIKSYFLSLLKGFDFQPPLSIAEGAAKIPPIM